MSQDDKIIVFPKMKSRLLDEVMELIDVNQFKDAYLLITDYERLSTMDDEVFFYKMICYMNMGEGPTLREEIDEYLLSNDSSVYYDRLMMIYIESLILEGDIRSAEERIDQVDPFMQDETIRLQLKKSLHEKEQSETDDFELQHQELKHQVEDYFHSASSERIERVRMWLNNRDVEKIPIAIELIKDDRISEIEQTMILEYLVWMNYGVVVTLTKYGHLIECVPSETKTFDDYILEFYETYNILRDLESSNPSSFYLAKEAMMFILTKIYPMYFEWMYDLEEEDVRSAFYQMFIDMGIPVDVEFETTVAARKLKMFLMSIQSLELDSL